MGFEHVNLRQYLKVIYNIAKLQASIIQVITSWKIYMRLPANLNNHRPILIELHSVLKFAERIVNDSKPGLISPLWSFSSCLVIQSCLHLHNDLHNDVWCNLFGTSSIIVQFFIHLMDHTRQPPASSTGIPPP